MPPDARKPGRPSQPIDRRTLIGIAARAFAEHGYSAASLNDIATTAGLRKASLYHHFRTKEELYTAVIDTSVADLRGLLLTAALAHDGFAASLERLGEMVIDYLAEHRSIARLITYEMLGQGPYARGDRLGAIATNLEAVAAFLEAGMQAGVFRRQDPRQLALSIAGMHLFYFATAATARAFLGGDAFDPALVRHHKAECLAHVRAMCLES